MSNAGSSSFHSQLNSSVSESAQKSTPTPVSFTTQNFSWNTASSSYAGPSTWHDRPIPTNVVAPANDTVVPRKSIKKKRTEDEEQVIEKTAARFAARLAADQAAVLHPDVDTPFLDTQDVINRLLPYHVFQQPQEDLAVVKGLGKGKRKATPEDDLRNEIAETKFALECFSRREKLLRRFRNARIRSGKRTAPDDQAYFLAQAVLEGDRIETTYMTSELRSARNELEKREREKRLAAMPSRPHYSHAPTLQVQPQFYHGYPYSYAQPYSPSAPMYASTQPVHAPAPAPPPPAPAPVAVPYTPGAAIPVQLPISSLPALHALGIIPVAVSSLPPPSNQQPLPPAILRSSSANGTMLNLEINVSLLQAAQMNGLALILNSIMTQGGGGPVDGAGANYNVASPSVSLSNNSG